MLINDLLQKNNMTKYRLAKQSEIPYSTLSDICSGKTDLSKCSAETVFRIARALGVSMEELIEPWLEERADFELYKSNVCHRVKELGDIDFLIECISSKVIESYYSKMWYPECFYLLAMVDYLSRINNIPLCDEYNNFRKFKLNTVLFPASILCLSEATNQSSIKNDAVKNAIPEFLRFNIVECDIRNVN